jgi:hypothetical protein
MHIYVNQGPSIGIDEDSYSLLTIRGFLLIILASVLVMILFLVREILGYNTPQYILMSLFISILAYTMFPMFLILRNKRMLAHAKSLTKNSCAIVYLPRNFVRMTQHDSALLNMTQHDSA